MQDEIKYPGEELELFREAHNWKRYFASVIKPFISGDVLENGAGISGTTLLLHSPAAKSWMLAEPDAGMANLLSGMIDKGELPANCKLHRGTIDTISSSFDTIIYIDVLEHIEKDVEEIEKASLLLRPAGSLIVLSPAFPYLYSPFDRSIGHYRRYTGRMLRKLTPPGLRLSLLKYYDSAGYFAALVNKLLLRQKYPSKKQVRFWDNWLVPVSRITDKLFFHAFGKTVIAVWKKSS